MASVQERGVLKVTVNNANNGGLLSAIDGLPAFLPFSLVSKRVGTTFITLEVPHLLIHVICTMIDPQRVSWSG